MMSEPKDCPFCGCAVEAEFNEYSLDLDERDIWTINHPMLNGCVLSIGFGVTAFDKDREKLVALWNRRALPSRHAPPSIGLPPGFGRQP